MEAPPSFARGHCIVIRRTRNLKRSFAPVTRGFRLTAAAGAVQFGRPARPEKSMLHVALWEPEIPPNTGNVARLCAATGTRLHLIGRLGFRLDDRSLKRAGLDYWDAVDVVRHVTFEEFERVSEADRPHLARRDAGDAAVHAGRVRRRRLPALRRRIEGVAAGRAGEVRGRAHRHSDADREGPQPQPRDCRRASFCTKRCANCTTGKPRPHSRDYRRRSSRVPDELGRQTSRIYVGTIQNSHGARGS